MPSPLNQCTLCLEDFGSLRLFDAHMVGKPSDRTRGCLTPAEMEGRGWRKDRFGRWVDPERAAKTRAAFRDTAGRPK